MGKTTRSPPHRANVMDAAGLQVAKRQPPRLRQFVRDVQDQEMDHSESDNGVEYWMPPDQEHQPEPQQGGESNFSPEEWENWALGVDQGLSNLEQEIEELKSAASNLGQTAEDRLRGIHIKMDALVLDLQQHYFAETRRFLDQNASG